MITQERWKRERVYKPTRMVYVRYLYQYMVVTWWNNFQPFIPMVAIPQWKWGNFPQHLTRLSHLGLLAC